VKCSVPPTEIASSRPQGSANLRHLLALGTVASRPPRHANAGSSMIPASVARVPAVSGVVPSIPGA
jgi:hypothetical protein